MTFSLAPVKARFIDRSACLFSTVPTNIQHFNLVKRNATDNDNLVKANVTDNDNCNADKNDQYNGKFWQKQRSQQEIQKLSPRRSRSHSPTASPTDHLLAP